MNTSRRVAGFVAALVGGLMISAAVVWMLGPIETDVRLGIVIAAGAVLLLEGGLMFAGTYRRSASPALLRLDWFLPALRRSAATREPGGRAGTAANPYGQWVNSARSVLPADLFSDRRTKRRGLIRRGLRKLGMTWLYAPVRRLTQAVCFLTFLGLFFYVCWPYDARPRKVESASVGWRFIEFGQSDAQLHFEANAVPPWLQPGTAAFIVEGDKSTEAELATAEVIAARVAAVADRRVSLVPHQELSDPLIDRLLIGNTSWQFFAGDPTAWPSHYADNLQQKERLPAELFLIIDPLVSLSTAIASRSWVWSLACAGTILIVCLLIPRGFCGYLCPLGTLIDLFDWSIGRRVTRFRVADDGWWVHIKYYLLAGTLLSAVFGVLISGYVAAIPVITRGMLLIGDPLQDGVARGWHLIPPVHAGHLVSIAMFLGVLSLGFLKPRFWCKYVCPSGATFSLGNLFRLTERKVESSCIHCNKCVEVCPFDAIKPDFTTRGTDCTLCQTCAGACPTQAIKFVERNNLVQLKIANDPPTNETPIGRRGFLSLAGGTTAAVVGGAGIAAATRAWGAGLDDPTRPRPVRPPGSVPEDAFLELCIRCGECFKACPNDVLQLQGFSQGF
ncbi:MAG: 4Fe-4S binding protein, partial [Planctomycetaceae bacterium]